MSPLWKAVLCLTLFAAWRSQVEFRTMSSRRPPLDCAQRCPCSGESYLHRPYSHTETPMLAEAPPAGRSVSAAAAVGGHTGGKASCLPLAREVGVREAT